MSSRLGLAFVILLAVGALGYLLVGNPFAPGGGVVGSTTREGDAPGELARGSDTAPAAATPAKDASLAAGYESLGKGDLKARLLTFKDRKPLVGQAVRVTLRAGESAERTTGDDGRVTFLGLRAHKAWTLAIEGSGFSPVEIKGVAIPANGVADLGDLLLGDKVLLRGRVIDTNGKPIPGASVSAYLGGGLDLSQGLVLAMVESALDNPLPSDAALTDELGVFALASLAPGRPYQLKTKHSGHAMHVQADLVVSPDRRSALLTIVLGPGATVRGKVMDENGRAIEGATVIALEDAGSRMTTTTFKRDYVSTKADGTYVLDTLSRGARYRFGVSATGYAPVFDTMAGGLTVDVEAVRDFTLVKGGSIEGRVVDKTTNQPVVDARVAAVVGNLMRFGGGGGGRRGGGAGPGGGGGPVAPASTPSAEDEASTQVTRTDADGRFKLDGMKPGPVGVAQVKAHGYADYSASTFPGGLPSWGEVKAGETLTVNVALESGGSVAGKVLAAGPSGTAPVAGARVSVIELDFRAMFSGFATATTGEDGSFKVDGIRAPGRYTVTATAPGLIAPDAMAAASAVDMPEGGGVVSKDVLLSAAGAIEGKVVDSQGRPVGAARVRARAAPQRGRGGGGFTGGMLRMALPGGGAQVVLTDADGRYRLESIAAGEKTLVGADADEFVPAESEPVEVRAGETRTVDLTLTGGGTLRGRVIDDQGGVVASARLRIGHLDADNEAQGSLSAWRTDALLEQRVIFSGNDGTYEITRIPPGRTLVKVEKEGYSVSYRRDLTIPADGVVDNHVVTLAKGATISGIVKNKDGQPIAGVFVAATKQANPTRGGGGGAPAEATPSDGTVEPQMSDRTDAQGKFTIEGIPTGSSYSVLVWFAQGYRAYAQGDEASIKRGVPTDAHDVEFSLEKETDPASSIGSMRPPGVPPMPPPPPGMAR